MEQNNSKAPDGWREDDLEKKMLAACNMTLAGAHTIFQTMSKKLTGIAKLYAAALLASKDQEIERLKSELATRIEAELASLQSSIPGLLKEQEKEG